MSWFPRIDSNYHTQNQNLMCYHYTSGEWINSIYIFLGFQSMASAQIHLQVKEYFPTPPVLRTKLVLFPPSQNLIGKFYKNVFFWACSVCNQRDFFYQIIIKRNHNFSVLCSALNIAKNIFWNHNVNFYSL
mgnify:CR=1 FL=1